MKLVRWELAAAAVLILLVGGIGCAGRQLVSAVMDGSSLSLVPGDYEVVAPVAGKNCAGVFLWVFRFGSPSLVDAEHGARKAAAESEIVINKHVYWQSEWYIPIIVGRQCLRLEGIAVRLTR